MDELFADEIEEIELPRLPRPRKERWQPLRSGLLNIFKYEDEEFLFEDGRLLLRGNNGSGKSRVLALTLPFLFDGEMASHRVEPDGDPAKRMEWNLLMNRHENRLGYTWIEFGRIDAEGVEHFLTLGCGMHARKGTGIAPGGRWFFITTLRVGESLSLMSDNRVPLNRERLEAAIEKEGTVFRGAREYRLAVDEALFGLGSRYGPLIELLLQLRKPQIMRDFKADDLSRLLSEALTPLSTKLIDTVAVSFRSLESDRSQINDLSEARRNVEHFLKSYQHYMRVAVRRRATDVRTAQNRLEGIQREIRRLNEQQEANAVSLGSGEASYQQIDGQLAASRETERTLLASPEMKSADVLRQAAETRDARARQAVTDAALAREAAGLFERARVEREAAAAESARRTEAALNAHGELAAIWEKAGMPAASLPPADLEMAVEPARKKLEKAVALRTQQIALLREKNAAIAGCVRSRELEESRFEQRRDDVIRQEEEEARLHGEQKRILTESVRQIYEWEGRLTVLPLVRGEDWLALYEPWLPNDPSPLGQRIEAAYREASNTLAEERSAAAQAQKEQTSSRSKILEELQALRAGGQPEPMAPPTRADGIRDSMRGAPFWKLCGFRDEIGAGARAGFEAALEAAGLLDAWVTPEGELVDPLTQDRFFTSTDKLPGSGLHGVLRVEIDPADAPASMASSVERILSCIGAVEEGGATWVSAAGRWRNGPLSGAWKKPEAEYIGHAAREEARRRKIAGLESGLASVEEVIATLVLELEAIAARSHTLQEERDAAPSIEPLQRAIHRFENAQAASASARSRLAEVDQTLAKARENERLAKETRDGDAADLGLTQWKEPGPLHELEGLVAALQLKAAALWPAWDRLFSTLAVLNAATERESHAAQGAGDAGGRAQDSQRLASAAAAHFETLRETVGATADQVLERLRAVREALNELDRKEKQVRDELEKLRVQKALNEESEARAEENRAAQEQLRAAAARRLQLFAEKRLLEETGEALQPERAELGTTAAVELARRIEQLLENVPEDEEAWKRVQSGIQQQFSELSDQLEMRGYHPQAELVDEGVFAITCAFQGQPRTMTTLRQSLHDELQSREQMLDAREREVIENHLIGEVATELQGLIRSGEAWVRVVNEELDLRPASSGIKLRFVWEVSSESSDGLEAVRRQLLKMTAAWSPAERDSIGRFLQSRINSERAADESAPWQEHLRRALDYRAWHRFGIERFQDGQWKKLTKQTYGTGSGGEKALTLTLPQFAAAAAHYRSAKPFAPRLILLDEVFIGIDAPTRARLMGLLDSFDLDFVMTSEREWGCYATLPSLAICQLASRPESPAVHVTRWVWNGRTLKEGGRG